MNSTIHERPGVYSSYDASSVVSASAAAKTIGAAAVATKGTANKVELITSYEEGKSVFGEDASGVYGMSTLLRFLFANGAGAVKAVAVGKDESEEKDYASAFAALSDEEDVGVMVCDSAAQSVHLLLKTAAEDASAARHERIAVIGGSEETGRADGEPREGCQQRARSAGGTGYRIGRRRYDERGVCRGGGGGGDRGKHRPGPCLSTARS